MTVYLSSTLVLLHLIECKVASQVLVHKRSGIAWIIGDWRHFSCQLLLHSVCKELFILVAVLLNT